MRIVLIALFATIFVACVVAKSDKDKTYNDFVNRHAKKHKAHEVEMRKAIVAAVADRCAKHNKEAKAKGYTFTMALNEFSDFTEEEHALRHGIHKPENYHANCTDNTSQEAHKRQAQLPTVDWRQRCPSCLPVLNQGSCGSCWTFTTAAVASIASFMKTGVPIKLSEQNELDCDTNHNGCGGGWPATALRNLKTKTIPTLAAYPYVARQQACKSAGGTRVKLSSVTEYNTVNGIVGALAKGPVAVAVCSKAPEFQNYKRGIINSWSSCQIDHAVLITQATANPNGDVVYTVLNSWGDNWGEGGMFRVLAKNNLGHINEYAVTATA